MRKKEKKKKKHVFEINVADIQEAGSKSKLANLTKGEIFTFFPSRKQILTIQIGRQNEHFKSERNLKKEIFHLRKW